MLHVVLAVALLMTGYVLGSIPFGVLIGKWFWGVDVREHGSGNIGTTNVFRVLGKRAGTLVLICDMAKGFVPTWIAVQLLPSWLAVLVALVTVLGHTYSVFLRGGGGKGVATGAGVILALMWPVFIITVVTWAIVVLVSRMVSLASLTAALVFTVATFVFDMPVLYRVLAILATLVVMWAHRSNIRRIALRCENKVSFPWDKRSRGSMAGVMGETGDEGRVSEGSAGEAGQRRDSEERE